MASAQVVEMSVTNNSHSQDSNLSIKVWKHIFTFQRLVVSLSISLLASLEICLTRYRDAHLWKSKIWRIFFYNTLASNYRTTPPPPEKSDDLSSPSNRPPYPQINLELPIHYLHYPTNQHVLWGSLYLNNGYLVH